MYQEEYHVEYQHEREFADERVFQVCLKHLWQRVYRGPPRKRLKTAYS